MSDDVHPAALAATRQVCESINAHWYEERCVPMSFSTAAIERIIDAAIREATEQVEACILKIRDRAENPALDGTALCDIRDLCNQALSGTAGRDLLAELERLRKKASAADELFRGIQQIAESGDCGRMLDDHPEAYQNTVIAEVSP